MLLAIIYMVLITLFGLMVVCLFGFRFKTVERIIISYIIGVFLTTWLTFVLYLMTKEILLSVWLSLPVMIIPLIIFRDKILIKKEFEKHSILIVSIFLLFSAVITSINLPHYDEGAIKANNYAWADGALHLGYISNFAYPKDPVLVTPIYAGYPLTYPFLVDFHSALLHKLGLSLTQSVIFPNILFLTSLLFLFYILAKKLTGRGAIALVAVLILVCSGGLGFLQFLKDSSETPQPFYRDFIGNQKDYTYRAEEGFHFANFTADLLSQRTTLFGFNIVFIFLILFLPFVLKDESLTKAQILFLGIILGLLPLFHTHSFISLSLFMVPVTLFFFRKEVSLLFLAVLLALPQFIWMGQTALSGSFMELNFGWMSYSPLAFMQFWVMNLGSFLALIIIGLFITKNRKIYLCSFMLFIMPNIIRFQPCIYDNIKLFKFWQVFMAILCAEAVYFVYKKSKVISVILLVLTVFTGSLTLLYLVNGEYDLFGAKEVIAADWIRSNTPEDSVFLTNQMRHNSLVLLTGRKMFVGDFNWLRSHGIDSEGREAQAKEVFNGTLNPQDTIVTHLLIDKSSKDYDLDMGYLEKETRRIYENPPYLILEVIRDKEK